LRPAPMTAADSATAAPTVSIAIRAMSLSFLE
jgi:hypothetical protein